MPKAEFARINAEREEAGLPLYANPRNSGAGSLRQIDPRSRRGRQLSAWFYQLVEDDDRVVDRSRRRSSGSTALGFPVNPDHEAGLDIEGVIAFTERWREARHDLPYETDGVVVKVDRVRPAGAARDGQPARRAGRSPSSSRRSRSRRFVEDIVAVRRADRDADAGRPPDADQGGRLDGRAGRPSTTSTRSGARTSGSATGSCSRRPATSSPRSSGRSSSAGPAPSASSRCPSDCPVCDTPVVQDEGAVRVYCPNLACPARRRAGVRALRRTRRHGHRGRRLEGARAAAPARARQARGDFYRPDGRGPRDRSSGSRRKSAENLHGPSSRLARVDRWRAILNGLGIPQVGEQTAIDLAQWLVGTRPRTAGAPGSGGLRRRTSKGAPARRRSSEVVRRRVRPSPRALPPTSGRTGRAATSCATSPTPASSPSCRRPRSPDASAGPARRQDPGRDRHARGLQPTGGRGVDPRRGRQDVRLGARRRPTMSSPARVPARSWPRPRSWASRSSTKTGSAGCWPARRCYDQSRSGPRSSGLPGDAPRRRSAMTTRRECRRRRRRRSRALLAEAGADLRTQPEPGEWSSAPMRRSHRSTGSWSAGRYRWILAQDEPDVVGYDQALWVAQPIKRTTPTSSWRCSSPFGRPTSHSGAGRRRTNAPASGSIANGGRRASS